ncbi:HAD hydrolase family protein [Demequina sediminicola]|uniref:HAD hydrolase family protein n=1 Tax=Demequina sediminicola TaxID=1095026 RepID=UPI000783F137|nr:HAD family hydrolase [Demequina sediminicola]
MTSPSLAPHAVFLDVDGTYAAHGVVPAAHVDAVRRARANGHAVLLCTGRPVCAVSPHLHEAGFDGLVTSAGAHVEVRGTVLADVRFPADVARRTVEALDAQGALYALEAPESMYGAPEVDANMRAKAPDADAAPERRKAFDVLHSALVVTDERASRSFSKVFVIDGGGPVQNVLDKVGPEVSVVAGSNEALGERTGEIYLSHITKAVGMEIARQALDVPHSRVVAAGDGPNDLELLREAGKSIVISTAIPALTELADIIAAPPEEHGLVAAFETLGLI